MKKNILLIFLFLSYGSLLSDDFKPNYWYLGASIGLNYHIADFKALPNIPNASPGFNSGIGFMPNFTLGYDRELTSKMFGLNWMYSGKIIGNFFDANLIEQQFIGYDIEDNIKREINVEHRIFSNISMISLENGLTFNKNNSDLQFNIGLGIGYIFGADYQQEEYLLLENRFFENGEKTRYNYSGELPNLNKLQLYTNLGMRYRINLSNSYLMLPFVNFKYCLNDLVDGLDWNISQLEVGFALAWHQPVKKEKPIPPNKPINSNLPLPEKPKQLKEIILDCQIVADNIQLQDKDTLSVFQTITNVKTNYEIPSTLYYDKNGIEPINDNMDLLIKTFAKKGKKENSLLTLEVFNHIADSTDKSILKNRVAFIQKELEAIGIENKNIVVKYFNIEDELSYPQLLDEYRRIELNYGDKGHVLTYSLISNQEKSIKVPTLTITPLIESETEINSFHGNIRLLDNSNIAMNIENQANSIDLTKDFRISDFKNEVKQYSIDIKVANNSEQVKEFSKSFYIKYTIDTLNVNSKSEESTRIYIAFSDFDKPDLKIINSEANSIIFNAMKENRKITIVASTDDLGSIDYNKSLAERRLKNAIEIFKLQNYSNLEKKTITPTSGSLITIQERVMSRSVYIEID